MLKLLKPCEISHFHWIVSYDNVNEIREIYRGLNMADYSLSYTAQDKKKGLEVIIYNDGVNIPEI